MLSGYKKWDRRQIMGIGILIVFIGSMIYKGRHGLKNVCAKYKNKIYLSIITKNNGK